jgi:hypothetical protein
MPGHAELLDDAHALNRSFMPMLDSLVCYKSELAMAMQRVVESFNMLLLEQFESYYRNENKKENELNLREKRMNRQQQEIDLTKETLYAQQDMVKTVMLSKDNEVKELHAQLQLAIQKNNEITS